MARTYLSKKLRDARKAANMDTDTAGALIGRSGKAVAAWEAGRNEPSPEMLIDICKAYNVAISFFFPPDVSIETNPQSEEERLLDLFANCSLTGKQRILEYSEMIIREFPKTSGVE